MKYHMLGLMLSITFLLNAQSEYALKQELEGQRVEILIEMPASSQGIDIRADRLQKMDFEDYSNRIKEFGIALFPGDVVMITKIKKKNKHIEFQLAGGGYGTFGDDSGSVSAGRISKTSRHEEIEKLLKEDKDKKLTNRRDLEKELKDLERDRQIAQRDSDRQASLESEMKKSRIQDQRLQGGSRFNIRYDYKIGSDELTTSNLITALKGFVNFNPANSASSGVTNNNSQDNNSIRKGLNMDEVMSLMGLPKSLNISEECGLEITKCVFEDSTQKVEATFAEKVLVKYAVMSR